MKSQLSCLFLAALGLAITGCGGTNRPAAIPVEVRVTYKGQPATGALIVFHPTSDAREKEIGGKPVGKVNEDGSIKLTTYESGDGAPEGEYGITVQWTEESKAKLSLGSEGGGGRDKLGGRYGDPRSPKIKATVKKGETNKIEIKLD